MLAWIGQNQTLLWWLSAASVFTFMATLFAIPLLVARMPVDYFSRAPIRGWPTRHPAVHILLVVMKNALGVVLLFGGVVMLVIPGQGLLTILIGVMLLDFPGKRRLELWLFRRKPIHRAMDWIRARRHQPPLELPQRMRRPGRVATDVER
jgi:hypothetical protein